ncbi:hypothetical protein ABOM_002177 [Aspergillus bombycis]|uniref:Uncharacterized protein n=1 Tax=Aspergillus bombycis TaxID=109264 RepID=A0A1F8A953_9EURO|nr:hypothetical protein ABOM_002177 [Aspergillus bombycis]OGM48300.1 hypothetical protein ABOM_002177 [Aspergillus bombycis]
MPSFMYKKKSSGGFPSCRICRMGFQMGPGDLDSLGGTNGLHGRLRRHRGLYHLHQLRKKSFITHLDWSRFYRVYLHDTRNDNYRILGVSIHIAVEVLEAVPRDTAMGVIGYPEKDRDRLIQATRVGQDNDTSSNGLVGYYVHDSCWELLTHHAVGEIARRYLALVVKNLLSLLKEKPLLALKGWREAVRGNLVLDDPAPIKIIQHLIKQTRTRPHARFYIQGPVNSRLCYLPVEILYEIMDYVSPNDVKNVQIAIEYSLGDGYWRTRVRTKLVYEGVRRREN